jgi:DNA primase
LEAVIGFYHETLLASPEALAYLDKRGLSSREMVDRFRLGDANRTLASRLKAKQWKAGAAARGQLQRIGYPRRRRTIFP